MEVAIFISFLIINLSMIANSAPVCLDKTVYNAIVEKCPFVNETKSFADQEIFKDCDDWCSINELKSLSKTTETQVLCLIYYDSFVLFCSKLNNSKITAQELIPDVKKNTLLDTCPSDSTVQRQLKGISSAFDDKDKCLKLCTEFDNSTLPVCRLARYYLNYSFSQIKPAVSSPSNNVAEAVSISTSVKLKGKHVTEMSVIHSTKKGISQQMSDILDNKNKPVPKTDSKPESPSKTGIERPVTKKEYETDDRPIADPDAKKGHESDNSPNVNHDITKEPETDNSPNMNPDIKKEPETDNSPNVNPDIKKEPETDHSPNVNPDIKKEPETDNSPNVNPDIKNQHETDNSQIVNPDIEKDHKTANSPISSLKKVHEIEPTPGKNKVEPTIGDKESVLENSEISPVNEDEEDQGINNYEESKPMVSSSEKKAAKTETLEGRETLDGLPANYNNTEDLDGESYFFFYFMVVCVLFVLGYVGYHNRQKVLAIVLEGKRGKRQYRRRPNSANYHKLDSNLEEAISSSCTKNSSNVIY